MLLKIIFTKRKMDKKIENAVGISTDLANLGRLFEATGEKEKALEYYQKTVDLDANNADAAYNAGLILFGLNRVEEALANFESALKAKPGIPEYLEMAGRCHINQGNFPKAIEYLEQARGAVTDPDRIKFLDDLITKLKEQIKQ